MKNFNNKHYRSDIDGLRALAVLLVIFYHAKFPIISGGFIGVDVFFVISGFLITSIILREISRGTFSYSGFYLRRIRRIIPVLVLVLVVTTITATILFFPYDLENHSRMVIHSFLSTANFHLWINGSNYFSPDTDLIPLLHVWSLSVEEQFYFIWPAFLVVLFPCIKKKLLFSIFFISLFLISQWMSMYSQLAAYLLLPARAFELLMGGGLAIYWKKVPVFTQSNNNLLSYIGFILIILSSLILTKTSQFPGINAFWPCLGTVLLIVSGKNQKDAGFINRILSQKPIVFIGLISYSLYLWHWPVFVFINYSGVELTNIIRFSAIFFIFILSYLSWRFVEIPFHYQYKWDLTQTLQRIMLPSFLFFTTLYAFYDGYDGFPVRFNTIKEFNKEHNFPSYVRSACFDKYKVGNLEECFIGNKKNQLDGVLIGDSYGNHTAAFLDVLAKDANLYIHDSTAGAYPLLARKLANGSYDKSPIYGHERLKYAKQFKNIFIAANWDLYATPSNINYNLILNDVNSLVSEGIQVVVFSNLRATTKLNLQRYKLFKTRDKLFFDNTDFSIPLTKRPDNFIVTEMKRRNPSIIVIDPNTVMCDKLKCDIEIDGSIIYRSEDHLNLSGGALLGRKYLHDVGNPLSILQ